MEDVNIAFKNEIEENTLTVSFEFKTRSGSIQKNIFRYKADPRNETKLLVQVRDKSHS